MPVLIKMKVVIITVFVLSCNASISTQKVSALEPMLYTGIYVIDDTQLSLKRQLLKTDTVYDIVRTPIVTAGNFVKAELFHEKDCYAVYVWLDKEGSTLLDAAKEKYHKKKFGIVVDNQLIRIQFVDDPQFATVDNNADPRIYGQVLAFPCNSFSPSELKSYETILNREK